MPKKLEKFDFIFRLAADLSRKYVLKGIPYFAKEDMTPIDVFAEQKMYTFMEYLLPIISQL